MYPSVPPGFVLGRYIYGYGDQIDKPAVVFGFTNTGGLDAVAAATALRTAWSAASCIQPVTVNTWGIQQTEVVVNTGGVLSEATDFTSLVGTVAGPPASPQVAALMSKVTGLIGRHYRGRTYWPGLAVSQLDGDGAIIQAGPLAAWNTAVQSWMATLHTAGLDLCIFHRLTTVPPTPVVNVAIEGRVATQRRRNRRVAHR